MVANALAAQSQALENAASNELCLGHLDFNDFKPIC